MPFEHYISTGGKRLRCGYTTGTCAALAAAGAARLLLTGHAPETVSLRTPKGWTVEVPLTGSTLADGWASCAVIKDGGDDQDATHGLAIVARVARGGTGVTILGGPGVGRVTRPGLDQEVGRAAINRVPRQMIAQAVTGVLEELGAEEGVTVTISVPGGEEAAKRTFNPHLGIEGGISILGTSGIVEPMSVQAMIDTMALEVRQAAARGARRLVFTPGNYGADFLSATPLVPREVPRVKCSNFIGEALDQAGLEGFEAVLLVGHVGKLVKLAGGVMNTHSRWADCRGELFCAHAALMGAGRTTAQALMDCATADSCLQVLDRAGLRQPVLDSLLAAIQRHMDRRAGGKFQTGAVLFSNEYGLLGMTGGAKELLEQWNRQQ